MRVQIHSMPKFSHAHRRKLLLLALLSLGSIAAVWAQAVPVSTIPPNRVTAQDLEAAFKRADRNSDGKLSREEAERFPVVAQGFEQIDSNRDNVISLEEFSKAASS